MPFSISHVDEVIKDKFEAVHRIIKLTNLRDDDDYIYEFDALKALKGKKYHKKKNHINKFINSNESWAIRDYDPSDYEPVKALMRQWIDEKELWEDPNIWIEYTGTLQILQYYQLLKLEISLLVVEDERIGLIIGEISPDDTLLVHVEKANTDYAGAYTMIGYAFYNHLSSKYPNLKWINREQDLGIEGLRKSKLSYHPIQLLQKYDFEYVND